MNLQQYQYRLGNLIQPLSNNKLEPIPNTIARIWEIHFREVWLLLDINKDPFQQCWASSKWDNTAPFVLTEDWLLDLGFKQIKSFRNELWIFDRDSYADGFCLKFIDGGFSILTSSYLDRLILLTPFKTKVHTLQNTWYGIFGKELDFQNISDQFTFSKSHNELF